MAPNIQSETERIFCPPNSPENQNSEKMKKESEDVIILHMCTKNHNHDVWFLRCKAPWAECFVIWGIFCPLTLLTTQKLKILKKLKKHLDILSLYTTVR